MTLVVLEAVICFCVFVFSFVCLLVCFPNVKMNRF